MTDASLPQVEELKPGDVIDGKYQVERDLGIGGMGRVVLALHLGLEERVALKMLLPEATRDPEAVARFGREAKAAARIKSEHVSRVLDVSALGGKMPYIVMEYLEGSDLEQIVDSGGPLTVDDAVDYVLQACEALAEAHARGVIHRDLKPGNLHLSRRTDGSPMVKVLDFGISKIRTRDNRGAVTSTSALLGSPLYMSPEQMKATRDVDARSDIWAMGVVLYELLTARSPFHAPSMPQVCARVLDTPPDSLARAGLPIGLEAVVMKCLEKKANSRFRDVAAFALALQPFAPERSEISIARILKTIGAPISNNLFFIQSDDIAAHVVSRSARTISETITNATLPSQNFLAARRQRRTISYGAAGALTATMLLVGIRNHSHASARADTSSPVASPVVAADEITNGPAPIAEPPTSIARPSRPQTDSAIAGSPTKTVVIATSTTSSPMASATASAHARKRNQDLSKLFGGRD